MGKLSAVISCLLLTVAAVTAQTAQSKASERPLPQWLTGIIAVSAFLFLAFVSVLAKKAWCDDSSREKIRLDFESVKENEFVTNGNAYDTRLTMVMSKVDTSAYDNLAIDSTEDKVTAM